jgi:hypothetical protein
LSLLGVAHASDSPVVVDQASDAAAACALLTPWPWPTSTIERRLHLRRMAAAQDQCVGHAVFLAALGALWLEEGEPERARVWLERSLLLEPESLGAQADHALALAALGEPAALKELASSWRGRADVPVALRRRIDSASTKGVGISLAAARLGGMSWPRYAARGEAAVLLGYDTNLAVSPRISEVIFVDPGNGNEFPGQTGVAPRKGGALRSDLSWQTAWELDARRVVRTGFSVATRTAPGESGTNWYQLQAAASYTQRWNGLSASGQADLSWFGGALTEPYALGRARLVLERLSESCSQAAQLEIDSRRQQTTRNFDSTAALLAWRLQCRPLGQSEWQWSVALRGGVDRPNHEDRPGGVQRSLGGSLRLEYRPSPLSMIELSIGTLRLDDRDIYDVLLKGQPVRYQAQTFATLEFSHALNRSFLPGAEWIFQVSRYNQTSNVPFFQHQGTSAYTGLRWPW